MQLILDNSNEYFFQIQTRGAVFQMECLVMPENLNRKGSIQKLLHSCTDVCMYILGHQKYQEGDTTKYLEWLSLDGGISGESLLFFFFLFTKL